MFIVTEAARIRLVEKLARKRAGDNVAMRFVRRRQGWSLRPDAPASNDVAFVHEGRTVLVLDPRVAHRLADRTLDAQDTPAGSRLRLR
jgi:hypothetical protein